MLTWGLGHLRCLVSYRQKPSRRNASSERDSDEEWQPPRKRLAEAPEVPSMRPSTAIYSCSGVLSSPRATMVASTSAAVPSGSAGPSSAAVPSAARPMSPPLSLLSTPVSSPISTPRSTRSQEGRFLHYLDIFYCAQF